MPRGKIATTEAHRELEDADISFANGLVDQGLIPKASMNRVLKVISASDRDTLVDSPNDRSKRIDSASSQTKKIDLQSLPRTWKEADKMASIRASMKPKTRKSPPRSGPKVSNGTKLGSDAEAKPSRKKKSLYATSRGPKRDARSSSPSTRPQRGKAVSTSNLALRDAVLRGDSSYVRTLLRGGDCDIESYDRATGASLLHICAHEGLFEVADILIAHGANVNHANKNHESPLHWAASGDSAKIAQLLLDFGADMDALDDSGSTALMRAAAAGSPNVLAVLLSRGGDVNTPDYDGFNSVDLMEHCLSEEPRPESDAALEEGALTAAMLMLRHITSRREDGRGGVSHQDEEEEEKAEQKRLQVTQRLQRAIEGRITARRSLGAANEVASGDPSPPGPLPGVALSKEESLRDEFQAAITETALMIDTAGAFPGKEQAVRDQFQAAVSHSFQAVQAAVDFLSLSPEHQDEGEADQDGSEQVETATNSSPEQTQAQAPAPAPAVTTKPSRGVKGGAKVTLSGGTTRKDARTRLLGGAANKRGTAFKLGASAVSPLRRRVVVKYAPAQFLPFLPGADRARPGDVIVAVEQCADCENHGWNLRHDSKRYTNMADRCLIAVVRGVLEKKLPVRVFALKDVPKRGRLGALEVTVAVRNASGAAKPWTTHTVFSKLESSSWPSAKKVATKARAFVRWALKEGGVSRQEEPRAAPESLSDILEEEAENEREEKGRAGGAGESAGPEPEGAREDSCVDWESRLVGMEKQFMAWLMRLSAKGEAPAIAAPPVLDLLGAGAAMSTPLEMCRRQVAQKGAFVPAFMEVALGVGGGELTSAQFDALVLEHFFVFSGVDDVDPASLEAPGRAAVSTDVSALEDGASASSAAPQPCLDEGEGEGASAQPLTIDVEVVDQSRQGKASSSVLGMDSPVFDIIEKHSASHGAPAGDGSGGQGGGEEGQSGAVATAPLPQAEEEAGEESKEPLLAVGTRVEGNYMGSGQWYKGVITAASRTGGYDIEYDDDEVELGVKAELVREVKRLPFHVRMEQKARAADAAATAAARAEEEMGRQRRGELPVDEAPLSPAHGEEGGSQEVAEDPFLQLSASDGGMEKPIVEP